MGYPGMHILSVLRDSKVAHPQQVQPLLADHIPTLASQLLICAACIIHLTPWAIYAHTRTSHLHPHPMPTCMPIHARTYQCARTQIHPMHVYLSLPSSVCNHPPLPYPSRASPTYLHTHLHQHLHSSPTPARQSPSPKVNDAPHSIHCTPRVV